MICESKDDIINELAEEVCYEVSVTCSQVFKVKVKNTENVEDIVYSAVEDAINNHELEVTSQDGWDNIEVIGKTKDTNYIDMKVDEGYYD